MMPVDEIGTETEDPLFFFFCYFTYCSKAVHERRGPEAKKEVQGLPFMFHSSFWQGSAQGFNKRENEAGLQNPSLSHHISTLVCYSAEDKNPPSKVIQTIWNSCILHARPELSCWRGGLESSVRANLLSYPKVKGNIVYLVFFFLCFLGFGAEFLSLYVNKTWIAQFWSCSYCLN